MKATHDALLDVRARLAERLIACERAIIGHGDV
jgi:hypothetical protein